jgi:hypothetical protein
MSPCSRTCLVGAICNSKGRRPRGGRDRVKSQRRARQKQQAFSEAMKTGLIAQQQTFFRKGAANRNAVQLHAVLRVLPVDWRPQAVCLGAARGGCPFGIESSHHNPVGSRRWTTPMRRETSRNFGPLLSNAEGPNLESTTAIEASHHNPEPRRGWEDGASEDVE